MMLSPITSEYVAATIVEEKASRAEYHSRLQILTGPVHNANKSLGSFISNIASKLLPAHTAQEALCCPAV